MENGGYMFYSCDFTTFPSALPSLTNGSHMFANCNKLTSFSSDLSSLSDGTGMFGSCSALTSFSSALPSLTNGNNMFRYCTFTSFTVDLPNLTDGCWMFDGCRELISFSSDLHNLTYGENMFYNCSKLTTFTSDLSSLKSGYLMFKDCEIDTESLRNIAEHINDINGLVMENDADWEYEVFREIKTIPNGRRGRIDIDVDSSVTQEVRKECGNKLNAKGWTIVYINSVLY